MGQAAGHHPRYAVSVGGVHRCTDGPCDAGRLVLVNAAFKDVQCVVSRHSLTK